jgi:mannan endo-1,4-beta-mannosidase
LNRDENSFSAKATTIHRDIYFEEIFKLIAKENIAGCNFWGSFGVPSNTTKNKYWNATMPYSADPPQEEQGLYSVFKNDKSTWLLVKKYNQLLKK